MIARWAIAPLIAGRMAGHQPLNRYAVPGGALRRFPVDVQGSAGRVVMANEPIRRNNKSISGGGERHEMSCL